MHSGIYLIRCHANEKFYIGSAVNLDRRWRQHQHRLNNNTHTNPHLQNAWNKYGSDAFEFYTVEEVERTQLIIAEQAWIDLHWDLGVLFNKDRVAGSRLGTKVSDETKVKIRMANLGRVLSQETRQKIGTANMGNTHAVGSKGRLKSYPTEETRRKLSLAKIGNKNRLGGKQYLAMPEERNVAA